MRNDLKYFRFWCYKVLPLTYDNSLSYYEVLCKVVAYINDLIAQDKIFGEELENLRADLTVVQEWIANFDTKNIEELVSHFVATMIFVEINNDGYIVYNMPESWDDIDFNTTGLDIEVTGYDYGHLTLSY